MQWYGTLNRCQSDSLEHSYLFYFRHIDGHDKLIWWRMVIHGCIDGFSRFIIYLHCSDNNFAETVERLFSNAVREFYWPRRVRSDQGMENIDVARLMLAKFGTESKPYLTGLSVHNQRIERLWKDVVCYIVGYYREMFYWMENEEILDPLDEVHLLALQIVYIPRINKSLTDFISHWNHHPLRTEHAQTPSQLWIGAIYDNIDGDTVRDLINPTSFNPDEYGVDIEAFDGVQTNNDVVIPRCPFDFNDYELNILRRIDPFQLDEGEAKYGIDVYNETVSVIKDMTTVQAYYN